MYYFIVNPNASGGRAARIWNHLEKQLRNSGVAYQALLTKQQGDAGKIAKELTDGCQEPRVIVVVGGDGTMNEVLDGLIFYGQISLGFIPAGSANDLAKSLNLPRNPKKCLKKVLYPRYHKMLDYGVLTFGADEIRHRRFMVSSGIGFDAAVCHNLLHSKWKSRLSRFHMEKLSYILIGGYQLLRAKPAKGYLVIDGEKKIEFGHLYFSSVHIHPFEGGGFQFAPKADCMDGKLTVCLVSCSSKRKLLPVLFQAWKGNGIRVKGARYYECREAQIHVDRPLAVHVDGESCFCQRDLEVCCVKKQVRMIV